MSEIPEGAPGAPPLKPKPLRVLLTGATGFIGGHLVRALLREGHEVTAFVRDAGRLGPIPGEAKLSLCTGDLERRGDLEMALEGHDVCVHAALVWGPPGSELDMHDTQVAARLFHAAGAAGLRHCVLLSSAAVHLPFRATMRAEDALAPSEMYGVTKAAAELVLGAACAQHEMRGTCLRAGPVVGPVAFDGAAHRSPHRLALMIDDVVAGRDVIVSEGDARQFTPTALLADTVAHVLKATPAERTYLCMEAEPLPWAWVAETAIRLARSESRLRQSTHVEQVPTFETAPLQRLLGTLPNSRAAMTQHLTAHLERLQGKPG
jgi:UDP-glucose 4-epimerase